jgi:hypothetical protein
VPTSGKYAWPHGVSLEQGMTVINSPVIQAQTRTVFGRGRSVCFAGYGAACLVFVIIGWALISLAGERTNARAAADRLPVFRAGGSGKMGEEGEDNRTHVDYKYPLRRTSLLRRRTPLSIYKFTFIYILYILLFIYYIV